MATEQLLAPSASDDESEQSDPTGAGGGTIGTGQAPTPGEQGFTGNAQQQQGTAPTEPQGLGQQPGAMGTVQ